MYIFYLLIFLLLLQGLIIPCDSKNGKRLFLVLSLIELQVVAGLRVPVGGDTEYYTKLFLEISRTPFKQLFHIGLEKGFVLFCYLLSFISKRPQTLVFFSSLLLNVLVLYYIYKKSKIVWLSVFLYVSLMAFFNAMNLMRFAIAYTILLYANDYVVKRQYVRLTAVLLLAASFHFSSLMYAIIYFIYPMKLTKKNMVAVAIPFGILALSFNYAFQLLVQLNVRYTSYGVHGVFYQSAYANILEFLISLVVFGFAVWCNKKIAYLKDEEKLYMWMLFIAMIFTLMSINVMIVIRFSALFALITIVYLPNLLSRMSYNQRDAWIFVISLFAILKMAVVLTYRSAWYFALPYRNWLL